MRTQERVFATALCAFAAATIGAVTEARASNLDACGGIYLEASAAATCQVLPTETCTVKCEPVAGEIVCAARLNTTCETECTATAAVECVTSCEGTCVPSCTTQEATQPPNCMGLCMSDCQQDCTAACADASNQGECRSSCAQCCSSDCHAQCDSAPPPSCEPVCTTACTGSCEGRANIDCQISCQSSSFATCKTQVVEECKNECTTTGAAIFCNGQFLATAGNLQACADQIEAAFQVHLDVKVSAEVECSDGSCTGHAEAAADGGLGCATAGSPGGSSRWSGAALLLVGLGAVACRRPRRRA